MKMRSLAAGLITAVVMAGAAGAASATTYLLTQDSCSGGGCIISPALNAGSITVTSITGGLHFDLLLAANVYLNQAGQGHEALGFNFTNLGSDTLTNFVETNVVGNHPTGDFGAASFVETGNGDFDGMNYGLDWSGANGNGHLLTTGIKRVTFDVLGSNLLVAAVGNAPATYFKVDVASVLPTGAVRTGLVGATLVAASITTAVPEPASWALMIVGFGGVGAVLRRSRRRALAA